MSTTFALPVLSFADLLTRGYFHDRVIPPLNALAMQSAEQGILSHITPIIQNAESNRFRLGISASRCVQHSVPKRKHARRMLSIPNPLPYSILCQFVASHWSILHGICSTSAISLSVPTNSTRRAVESTINRNHEAIHRARRSIGCRYLLKADLVRFYPSIYTHSIPWAIDGKDASRNDPHNLLLGNRLDACIRIAQDRQTGGIPIGPDTSYILGEVISARIDEILQQQLPDQLRGTRYIDDYHLYFRTRHEVDQAIAALHQAARYYELEINDAKTEIVELPEPIEPSWKTRLRSIDIAQSDSGRSVKAIFDRAAEFARNYSYDSVFTYLAKKLLHSEIQDDGWEIAEPLLLRAALAEPLMLQVLLQLFNNHGVNDSAALRETLESLCLYHAPLQQGTEVAWSLWLARSLGIDLSASVAQAIAQMDDDIVALVALDLQSLGLLPLTQTPLWQTRMAADHLYSEHWLLCYEASVKGWLSSSDGSDYIGNDPFFSLLRNNDVQFYDPGSDGLDVYSIYGNSEAFEEEATVDFDHEDGDDIVL